jgi:hypothetical protein
LDFISSNFNFEFASFNPIWILCRRNSTWNSRHSIRFGFYIVEFNFEFASLNPTWIYCRRISTWKSLLSTLFGFHVRQNSIWNSRRRVRFLFQSSKKMVIHL